MPNGYPNKFTTRDGIIEGTEILYCQNYKFLIPQTFCRLYTLALVGFFHLFQ